MSVSGWSMSGTLKKVCTLWISYQQSNLQLSFRRRSHCHFGRSLQERESLFCWSQPSWNLDKEGWVIDDKSTTVGEKTKPYWCHIKDGFKTCENLFDCIWWHKHVVFFIQDPPFLFWKDEAKGSGSKYLYGYIIDVWKELQAICNFTYLTFLLFWLLFKYTCSKIGFSVTLWFPVPMVCGEPCWRMEVTMGWSACCREMK